MHSITIRHRSTTPAALAKRFPGAEVYDLTSKGPLPWAKFSPFWPHGGIPVPFSEHATAESVEGVWQGLKVFEHADVDTARLRNNTMEGIKRGGAKLGRVLGHRKGLRGTELLDYATARWEVYLPSYRWVLEHNLGDLVGALRQRAESAPLVLLDYETNGDVTDLTRPLSHASLVAAWIENRWPTRPVTAP